MTEEEIAKNVEILMEKIGWMDGDRFRFTDPVDDCHCIICECKRELIDPGTATKHGSNNG